MVYVRFYFAWFVLNLNSFRDWKVLRWNVRGLNSDACQRVVRHKINESGCFVICLEETKCSHIDQRFYGNSVLDALIILCVFPQWALLLV